MSEKTPHPESIPSRSAAAAAARWGESHPEEDVEHLPPAFSGPVEEARLRHSASAAAAQLRWQERHPSTGV